MHLSPQALRESTVRQDSGMPHHQLLQHAQGVSWTVVVVIIFATGARSWPDNPFNISWPIYSEFPGNGCPFDCHLVCQRSSDVVRQKWQTWSFHCPSVSRYPLFRRDGRNIHISGQTYFVERLSPEDKGVYRCYDEYGDGRRSLSSCVCLYVYSTISEMHRCDPPPRFEPWLTIEQRTMSVASNSTLTLRCPYSQLESGVSSTRVLWLFQSPNGRSMIETGQNDKNPLRIHDVTIGHSGTYTCVLTGASRPGNVSLKFFVTVSTVPQMPRLILDSAFGSRIVRWQSPDIGALKVLGYRLTLSFRSRQSDVYRFHNVTNNVTGIAVSKLLSECDACSQRVAMDVSIQVLTKVGYGKNSRPLLLSDADTGPTQQHLNFALAAVRGCPATEFKKGTVRMGKLRRQVIRNLAELVSKVCWCCDISVKTVTGNCGTNQTRVDCTAGSLTLSATLTVTVQTPWLDLFLELDQRFRATTAIKVTGLWPLEVVHLAHQYSRNATMQSIVYSNALAMASLSPDCSFRNYS